MEDLSQIDWESTTNTLEEIAKFIFTSKYARYRDDLKRREDWPEAVERIENMHLRKFDHLDPKYTEEIRGAFDFVREKKVGPSMRNFQFAGRAVEAHNARSYNCSVRHVDSIRAFAEVFYLLLCGCGVGLGLSKRHLNKLPQLVSEQDRTGTVVTYVVEDTIEGWADSLEALLNCYFTHTAYSGRKIVFDYSRIRPEGAPLVTSGGKAPGYKGLKYAHSKIKELLDALIEVKQQRRLKTIDAYDILMHVSDAVLSGGVRRSATSVIFDKNDREMINAKTGNWLTENPQRARSNNSILLMREETTWEEFYDIFQRTQEWGEPGFVWAENVDTLYNPCFTLDSRILTDEGWRSFGELLGSNPTIMQDPRVRGDVENGREVWSLTGERGGLTNPIQAFNVIKTAEQKIVYKLTTIGGRTVRATGDHHFAVHNRGMVELANLQEGDKIMVGVSSPYRSDQDSWDFKLGFIAGLVYGDGNIGQDQSVNIDVWGTEGKENDYKEIQEMVHDVLDKFNVVNRKGLYPKFGSVTENGKRRLSSRAVYQVFESLGFTQKDGLHWLHKSSKDLKSGFISGMFYGDGHIEGSIKSKILSLRITQSHEVLVDIQLLLQELGVMSRIYPLLSISGKESIERALHFLWILPSDRLKLDQKIDEIYGGSLDHDSRVGARYWDKVVSVVRDGVEDVYCLQENENRTLISEGLVARRCFEIGFLPITKDGVAAVQFCNLSTVNGEKVQTEEDFYKAVEAAAIIGTLQATYTDFPYLSEGAKELTEEEALLGVSVTAMMSNPDVILDPDIQQKAAHIVVDTNRKWAEIVGINPAARTTAVKPEGTSSLAFGTMSSGIHPAHNPYMFRRVQVNKLDNVYRHFRSHNPHLCEESVWSANKTDDCVTFPIKVSEGTLCKGDLTAIEHLEIIKSTQQNWILVGKTERSRQDLSHNVSCTVVVQDSEWEEVAQYLYENRRYFSAVSLLAATGDKDYQQVPNEAVATEEDAKKFIDYLKHFIPVDYSWMEENGDNTEHTQEVACAGPEGCEVTIV